LLSHSESPAYKGGVGADILHIPLCYKDSFLLPKEASEVINQYIKTSEYGLSLGIFIAGLLCLTLEKHNFKNFDDHYKVPIYMLIGSSLSFFIVHCIFDVVEVFKICTHDCLKYFKVDSVSARHPVIATNLLYLTLVSMNCIVGGGLGIVYGITDVEGLLTTSLKLVYKETFHEIISLMPVGCLLGVALGFIFGALRALELHHAPPAPVEAAKPVRSETAFETSYNYDTGSDSDEEANNNLL